MTSPFPPGSSLVAYLRDSGGQEQEQSVTQQQEQIAAWAAANELLITHYYTDLARSGSTVVGRDNFEAMIQYLHKGGTGEVGVVIWKYSRFSRDFDDANFYKADLRRRGYEIYSMQDNVPSGPEGRLMESIIDWMNNRYLRDLSTDIQRGQRYAVVQYHAWFGRPPTGYTKAPVSAGVHRNGEARIVHQLVPDLATAPLVRRAFELRSQGHTLPEILREIPGIAASVPVLGRLLHNRIYRGIRDLGELDITDFCEPIVSVETWNAAQVVNADRRDRHGYNHPRRVRSQYVLTGLVECKRCGAAMHGRTIQNKPYRPYLYYRCGSINMAGQCGAILIPKDELEAQVVDRVMSRILVPDVLAELQAELLAGDDQGELLAGYRADLEDTSRRVSRITSAIAEAGHSRALLQQLSDLEAKQGQLREQIARIQATQAARPQAVDVVWMAGELRRLLESGEQRQTILRGFVRKIRAEKVSGKIGGEIEWFFPGGTATRVVSLE